MKKLTIKGAKIVSGIIIVLLIFALSFAVFIPEKCVSIIASESYSPYFSGNRDKNSVSVMFNVYENAENVEKILKKLEEFDFKATFFVGGCWADDNTQTLLKIVNSGNEIANHGYFHLNHKKLDFEQNIQEIETCHELIKGICGRDMTLFAPPSGAFNKDTLLASEKFGYKTIMWTKDTIDWRDSDVNKIVQRATKNLCGGDLILMHPKDHSVKALDEIFKIIKEKGLIADTVSEVIKENDL